MYLCDIFKVHIGRVMGREPCYSYRVISDDVTVFLLNGIFPDGAGWGWVDSSDMESTASVSF